jgi:universal stress protein A
LELAKQNNATISLIHAIEHINAYGVAQAYPAVIDLEEDMVKEAKEELSRLAAKFNIAADRQFVEVGSPKVVILNKTDEIKADLIIVGSHGRHGISLLLGSTANAVLHHATCDVLAIRIMDK